MALSLSLLGSPVVTVDDLAIEVDTRKAIALLAFLAVEGGSHPRDRLVDLLWPGAEVERGRSSLRRTLSALRKGLRNRWVSADRSFVSLDVTESTLDLDRFRSLVDRHLDHQPGEMCKRCVVDLTAGVALHRGDFLDGFYLRDAAAFESWQTAHSEHQRRLLGAALQRLGDAHAADGAYLSAVTVTRRRIAVVPLHEEAYRDLMLHQAWAGDRNAAIGTYRELVSVMDVELGVTPLDDTTALYESILQDDVPQAPAPARRPIVIESNTALLAVPLVGRDPALAAVGSALDEPGGVAIVTGTIGVGVTRFLDEVASHLRVSGCTVLSAAASVGGAGTPYGVIHNLLLELVDADREEIRALPAAVLSEASRLFPGLSPGAPPQPTAANRARFLDAISRLIGAVDQPVLVVDDAHLCDPASAEAISFLFDRSQKIGLRILVARVEGEETSGPAVDQMLHDLASRATTVGLEPLASGEVAELMAAFDTDLDVDEIVSHSGGLPLIVVEMLRASAEGEGTDSLDRLKWAVSARVDKTSEAARQILDTIVVLDTPADTVLIAGVSGRTPDETDRALDELVRRGLVRELADGTVSIAHSFLASVVGERTSAARRRVLHRRAAEVLAARPVTRGAAARIAQHHLLAGANAEAADWYVAAGEEAAGLFAHREAVAHYDAALAAGHDDRSGLHRSMAHSHLLDGRYDQALVEFEAALAAGDADPAGAERHIGEIHRRLQRWDAAAAHYDRALPFTTDDEVLSIVNSDRAYVESRRSDAATALPWVVAGLASAERSQSSRALARAHNVAGLLATEPEDRLTHLQRALDHAVEPAERVAVLNNLAASSPPPGSVEFAQEAVELAREIGDRHVTAALYNTLADALHASGDTDGSQVALTEAVALFAQVEADAEEPWVPEVWLLTEW